MPAVPVKVMHKTCQRHHPLEMATSMRTWPAGHCLACREYGMVLSTVAWHHICCTPSHAACCTCQGTQTASHDQVLQGDSTLQQKKDRVGQTVMPMLVDLYSDVHNRREEVTQKRARLQAELAESTMQLATVSAERASTVQWMLQCASGPQAGAGHDIMHAIAEHMQAAHLPAAAATFLTEASNQLEHM